MNTHAKALLDEMVWANKRLDQVVWPQVPKSSRSAYTPGVSLETILNNILETPVYTQADKTSPVSLAEAHLAPHELSVQLLFHMHAHRGQEEPLTTCLLTIQCLIALRKGPHKVRRTCTLIALENA